MSSAALATCLDDPASSLATLEPGQPSPARPGAEPGPQAAPGRLGRSEQARLNGAKSRGPVTDEGKARSSRNALKHGLTAAVHLAANDEEARALAELGQDLAEELRPDGMLASFLVARLAGLMWKSRRADALEAQAFAAGTPEPPRLDLALRYQAAVARGFQASLRQLRLLRTQPLAAPLEPRPVARSRRDRTAWAEPTQAPALAESAAANDDPAAVATPRNEPAPSPPVAVRSESAPARNRADAARNEPDTPRNRPDTVPNEPGSPDPIPSVPAPAPCARPAPIHRPGPARFASAVLHRTTALAAVRPSLSPDVVATASAGRHPFPAPSPPGPFPSRVVAQVEAANDRSSIPTNT